MERPFNLLDEFPHIVVVEPRAQPQGSCLDLEGWSGTGSGSKTKPDAEAVVYNLLEGFSRPSGLLPQFGADIVIEGERGSHTLMLYLAHHGVNTHEWNGFRFVEMLNALQRRIRWWRCAAYDEWSIINS